MMSKKIGKALVVGAGIGGIRSALDMAETGYQVTLIDRAAHIGGILSQLDAQFPTNHCGMCRMLPLLERDAGSQFCLRKGLFHENIEILTATRLAAVEGEPGRFTVHLRRSWNGVQPDLCVGCGLCAAVCPVEVADSFNRGLSKRKAIYLPVPHAVPNPFVIDPVACTRCGACAAVCPTQAIQLADDGRKDFPILVVDDELVMRDSLKEWLLNEGYGAVDTAASGAAALASLDQNTYRLMLTDIKMPGMDGVELLQLAKEKYPDLTVVMMTAYATVETAVEAMKIGALDYFMKPFDPEAMLPLVARIYEEYRAALDLTLEVQAIVLGTGTDFFNPSQGVNPYGYGRIPHVVTSLEYERILSGSGPCQGRLVRPSDGRPIRKVAWMQCVGSRDLQAQADFCSSICCMFAVKEALLTKEKSDGGVETAIFFMDMRAHGKGYQRYCDQAALEHGVRFERARVHSIIPDPESGDPRIRATGLSGDIIEESFDLIVLAVGQRPAEGLEELARMADLELNPWGFLQAQPFAPARASRDGIYLSGAVTGQKDIRDAVIQASAAALAAGRCIHAAGGSLMPEEKPVAVPEALLAETPRVQVVLCSCGGRLESAVGRDDLVRRLTADPAVADVIFAERLCTREGWDRLQEMLPPRNPNRLLIGACHPYLFIAKLKALSRSLGLPENLMDAVDLGICTLRSPDAENATATVPQAARQALLAEIAMSLQRLRHADPEPVPAAPVTPRALVVGGGLSGMQAALSIAAMGYAVDLVEKSTALGGNLQWLRQTLTGQPVGPLLEETVQAIQKQPQINVHLQTRVTGAFGYAGNFHTTLEAEDGNVQVGTHGAIVLATGGREAGTDQYGFGTHGGIVTQKELETRLATNGLDTSQLRTVVMIQCVGSREASRNFCSRVCCPTTLKHALQLKQASPGINVFVLYRDMICKGFEETYYTQARAAGVIFVQYDPANKPQVEPIDPQKLRVTAHDPILGADLQIETDLLVLATGVAPQPEPALNSALGIATDADGFFEEAEPKWRPVDSLKEGVFACGLTLAPMTIEEAVASGQAAGQRALRILTRSALPAGRFTATVRHSLCTLCRRCIETCPYAARWVDEEQQRICVDPGMCQGCGACAATCPNGAAVLRGCSKPQMLGMIDAVFSGEFHESSHPSPSNG
jgi:heterodisulfide reductase subunit A